MAGHLSLLHGVLVAWKFLNKRVHSSPVTVRRFGPCRIMLMASVPFSWMVLGIASGAIFYFLDLDNQNPMVVIPNIPYLIFVLAVALFATITSLVLARNLFRYVFQQIVMGAAVFILLIPNLALAQG